MMDLVSSTFRTMRIGQPASRSLAGLRRDGMGLEMVRKLRTVHCHRSNIRPRRRKQDIHFGSNSQLPCHEEVGSATE
jgi:hypothetical protein